MNVNTYGSLYGKFHQCPVSLVRNDIIVFDLGNSPYETWSISRMYPSEKIAVDSDKPFLLALKSFFKSDVPASVVSSSLYLWTISLGKERVIYPLGADVKSDNTLRLYATPYFVQNPDIVSKHLQGIRPAFENVYFYKNTIMYLDNQDLPYPGGYYFDPCAPTPFYRICFLTDESIDYVANLASEWQTRRDVSTVPFMTRDTKVLPKFIDFDPVPELNFSDSTVVSTGLILRDLSLRKPELIVQDLLISYYKNISRHVNDSSHLDFSFLGLVVEWPLQLTFEGSRHSQTRNEDRRFVALSVNGNYPNRVVCVSSPYDRYVEYDDVPVTVWTPISFVFYTLLTEIDVKKVIVDSVVIGLVYRETFFCLSQPLLEGRPTKSFALNTEYLLSVASTSDIEADPKIRIVESFKYDEDFSLRRVYLKGIQLETWCLTSAEDTHPYPKTIRLPYLVKEWLKLFKDAGPNPFDVDVSTVRLALTLSKHELCYNLIASEDSKEPVNVTDSQTKFYMHEKVVEFVNEARIAKSELETEGNSCVIS